MASQPLDIEQPDALIAYLRSTGRIAADEAERVRTLAGRVDLGHDTRFGRLLGQVHRRSWERRDEVAPAFDDRSFFESLRVEPYYEYTATQVPEAAGFLTLLIADTRARRFSLVHGDY